MAATHDLGHGLGPDLSRGAARGHSLPITVTPEIERQIAGRGVAASLQRLQSSRQPAATEHVAAVGRDIAPTPTNDQAPTAGAAVSLAAQPAQPDVGAEQSRKAAAQLSMVVQHYGEHVDRMLSAKGIKVAGLDMDKKTDLLEQSAHTRVSGGQHVAGVPEGGFQPPADLPVQRVERGAEMVRA